MKSNIIHETIIRDLIDLTHAAKDNDIVQQRSNFKNMSRSIASQSANLTAVFPVLVSNMLSLDTATMIAKATERKGVNMLQLLFAANVMVSDNGIENLKKYHNNLKIDDKLTVDGVKDLLFNLKENWYDDVVANDLKPVVEDCKRNLGFYLKDSINEMSIGDYMVLPSVISGETTVTEARSLRRHSGKISGSATKFQPKPANLAKPRDTSSSSHKNIKSYNNDSKNNSIADMKYMTDVNGKMLVDTDVKKPNELVPTVMQVRFVKNVKDGQPLMHVNHLIGVKSKLYVLDSKDIADRLILRNQEKNVLTKFFKATTREISFFKDFLFAIDQAKIDALSQSRKGSTSKLWKLLERRATMSKLKRSTGLSNDCMSITTLAITQEEVDALKKYSNVDLEDPSVIRPILTSLNLMGFIICDEINETAKFIYDTGEDIYEYYSYNSLEKEASDNSYKRMVKLMSQMGGR